MMGPEFFQTRMGQKYYEHDIPALIEAVNRLADAIEKQNLLTESREKTDSDKD